MGKTKLALSKIHPTALIHPAARIGSGSQIWAFVQIAEQASLGKNCIIGNGVYIDRHVKIGNGVWIQNKALIYQGAIIEDQVFIGPGVCFANDKYPRAGARRNMKNQFWRVGKGSSIGANSTIMPNISIGAYAVVAAGAVVTKDVPAHSIAVGNPAYIKGIACFCGRPLNVRFQGKKQVKCAHCGKRLQQKIA